MTFAAARLAYLLPWTAICLASMLSGCATSGLGFFSKMPDGVQVNPYVIERADGLGHARFSVQNFNDQHDLSGKVTVYADFVVENIDLVTLPSGLTRRACRSVHTTRFQGPATGQYLWHRHCDIATFVVAEASTPVVPRSSKVIMEVPLVSPDGDPLRICRQVCRGHLYVRVASSVPGRSGVITDDTEVAPFEVRPAVVPVPTEPEPR